jgi:predicted dinucleotide-binding enzyme
MPEESTASSLAVLGSGDVGRALAAGFAAAGHRVVLGSRDPGSAELATWASAAGVSLATPRDATRQAEVIVNATPGAAAVAAVTAAGGAELDGVVLLDVSNPLDFSTGAPTVFTSTDDSIGERLQHAFPRLRVVKSLCTVNNAVMVNPAALPEPTTMFVAGNDSDAKQVVTGLLLSLGWLTDQLLDLGGIEASRQLELNIMFWLRIYGAVGTADFNLRVVRTS